MSQLSNSETALAAEPRVSGGYRLPILDSALIILALTALLYGTALFFTGGYLEYFGAYSFTRIGIQDLSIPGLLGGMIIGSFTPSALLFSRLEHLSSAFNRRLAGISLTLGPILILAINFHFWVLKQDPLLISWAVIGVAFLMTLFTRRVEPITDLHGMRAFGAGALGTIFYLCTMTILGHSIAARDERFLVLATVPSCAIVSSTSESYVCVYFDTNTNILTGEIMVKSTSGERLRWLHTGRLTQR